MKKILSFAACCLISALTLSAQNKGDMSVFGEIGYIGGFFQEKVTTTASSTSSSTTQKTPMNLFTFTPKFGYFVMDNWEISAGLSFLAGDSKISKKTRNGINFFGINLGTHYYINICDNLHYTPGLDIDLGSANSYSHYKDDGKSKKTSKNGFAYALNFDLAKFEVAVGKRFGIILNVLSLQYGNMTIKEKMFQENLNITTTSSHSHMLFNINHSIGLKFYF